MGRRLVSLARAVRAGEASLMLGFPVVAGCLGMTRLSASSLQVLAPVLAAEASIALSIYAFNTVVGFHDDAADPKFAANPLHTGRVGRKALYAVAGGGALLGFLILAAGASRVLPAVVAMWAVWLAYSHPRGLKAIPGAATAAHVGAGMLMFLAPYLVERQWDARGLVLAWFFGLMLASGHANHEAMDEPADRAAGVSTLAVRFGRRRAILLNAGLAAAAYGVLGLAALAGRVETGVTLPFLAVALPHLVQAARLAAGPVDTAALRHYRSFYRVLFAAASAAACALHLAAGGTG